MGRKLLATFAVFVMMLTSVAVGPVSAAPPNNPGPVTAILAGIDGVDASWTAPVGGDPVVDYTVELLDDVPNVVDAATVLAPGVTHSFTSVDPGSYTVRVRANNPDGSSGDVDSAPVDVPDVPDAPAAPTTVLNGTNDIQVTWVAPASGGDPIDSYDVTLTASAGGPPPPTFTVSAPALTHTFVAVPAGTYTATVVATNGVGDSAASPASTPAIDVVDPPPNDPTGVVASVSGTVDLKVDWVAPAAGPSPTSYVITLDNGPPATSEETSNLTITFSDLNPGQRYVATVQSKNGAGTSPGVASAEVVIPSQVPDQVAQPTASAAGTDSLTVDWDQPNQNGSAIIDYEVAITRAGGATTTQSVVAPTTILTFTGLVPGNYTATVMATNGVGDGPVSPASNQVALGDVPDSPTGVAASSPTDTSMSVSFSVPADDGGSAIIDYTVTATPVGGGTTRTATGAGSPLSVSGLEPGTTYDFTVTARNNFGSSAPSTAVQGTTLGVPSTPSGVSAAKTGFTSAAVSFSAPGSDGGSAITSYTVTATPSDGSLPTVQATGTGSPIEVTGLSVGSHTYTFAVLATNDVGDSAPSAPSNALSFPPEPGVVANVGAENQTPFSSTVTVTWEPPADDGGSPILDYTVTLADQTETVPANTLTVTFTAVTAGKHTPTVTARTAGGSAEATGPEVEVRGFPPFDSEAAFIRQLYLDFLGREADQAGLDYWTGITNDDGSNIDEITRSFMFSAEFNPRRAITRLYLAFFDRAPDLGGFDYWAGQINSGQANLDTISQSFVMSPEFISSYGSLSDRDFIRLVYNNVLVRQPDQAGYDFWLGEMANGMTRGELMTQFSESPEFVQNTRPAVDVILTYRGMLDRVPDASGFVFWLGQIANDQNAVLSLITGFYNSPEYAGRIIP